MLDIKDIDLSMAPEGAQYYLLEPRNVAFRPSQFFRDVEGREGVEVLFYMTFSKTWSRFTHPSNFMHRDARVYSIEDIRKLQAATQDGTEHMTGYKRSDFVLYMGIGKKRSDYW